MKSPVMTTMSGRSAATRSNVFSTYASDTRGPTWRSLIWTRVRPASRGGSLRTSRDLRVISRQCGSIRHVYSPVAAAAPPRAICKNRRRLDKSRLRRRCSRALSSCSEGSGRRRLRRRSTAAQSRADRASFKNLLRHLHMDTDLAVDKLRHRDVARDARELVRGCLVEMFFGDEEIDHLLNGDLRRLREILVSPHADVIGRRFCAREIQRHPFPDGQLDASTERRLDRGLIDFAIPLRRVTVADFKQRARRMHRNEQRRPRNERLVVEISGMDARWIAADAPCLRRRGDADAAEEGTQRNDDTRCERRGHRPSVKRDDLRGSARRRAVVGHVASTPVVAVWDREIDREDLHFERIAWFRPFDEDR